MLVQFNHRISNRFLVLHIKSLVFFRVRFLTFAGLISVYLFILLSCTIDRSSPSPITSRHTESDQATILYDEIGELAGQGKYAEAIPLAKQLLDTTEQEKGAIHEETAASLNILGGLYSAFGDDEKAEPILKRALETREKLGGAESPDFATSLGLLSRVYMNLNDYSKAAFLANRALQIRKKTLGDDHFLVSTSLNTLGEIYLMRQDYEKAEPLFLQAIEIRKRHDNAHSLLITLNNLCQLYYNVRDYESAKSLAIIALELGQGALGSDHPHLAETFSLLGRINSAITEFEKAFYYLKKSQEIHLQSIDHMKGFTSEKQKLKFLTRIEEDFHIFLSLIFNNNSLPSESIKEGLNVVLKRKGIVLEVQKQFQKALVLGDERALRVFRRLSEIRITLSKLVFSGPETGDPKDHRKKINSLRSEKERLEIQLSNYSRPYTAYLKKAEANYLNVASRLPMHSALIEFIQVRPFNFSADVKMKWSPPHYYAFVLFADHPADIRVADLGPTEAIDGMISSFKQAVGNIDTRQALRMAGELYARLFSPLEREIGEIRDIFLSPDGNLNLIPFEVLRQPGGRFLVEDFQFNYLASGRDLLGFGGNPTPSQTSVVMGNPDFNLGAEEKNKVLAALALNSEPSVVSSYSRDLRNLRFGPLPGTEDEIQMISRLLGKHDMMLYSGKQALEEVLMQLDSPKFLHLATHGFFLAAHQTAENPPGLSPSPGSPAERLAMENPFLRSGLALAGANQFLEHQERRTGILTAEKVLALKLRGTDMVVLSACETGIGEVKVGEGVFGLRRAFIQAGTKSLVMSMWSVPDMETYELMASFYKNITLKKMNRAQALRHAILKQIQVVKERYGNPNPFYWGAFVFLGEP